MDFKRKLNIGLLKTSQTESLKSDQMSCYTVIRKSKEFLSEIQIVREAFPHAIDWLISELNTRMNGYELEFAYTFNEVDDALYSDSSSAQSTSQFLEVTRRYFEIILRYIHFLPFRRWSNSR